MGRVTKKNLLNRVDDNTFLKSGSYSWANLNTGGTNLSLASNSAVKNLVASLESGLSMRQIKTYTIE